MDTINIESHTCCFVGHRTINKTQELRSQLYVLIENLIIDESIDAFLFGSNSQFNDLCYEIVTKIKEKHTHIKRIYVRAEFPIIRDSYKSYLLESYEYTYYPENMIGAGKAAYVERNRHMIDKSQFCVFYYQDDYSPKTRKSGTKIALDYAVKKNKNLIIL